MQGTWTTFPRFMHSVLVGVSGLARENVRPAYQRNPPKLPDYKTDWLAYNLTNFQAENGSAYVEGERLERHESFDCVCVFYGLNAQDRAGIVRDSFELSQNRTALLVNGIGFKGCSAAVRAPELINNQYYERVDMTLSFMRQVKKDYRIFNFESAEGIIKANYALNTYEEDFSIKER